MARPPSQDMKGNKYGFAVPLSPSDTLSYRDSGRGSLVPCYVPGYCTESVSVVSGRRLEGTECESCTERETSIPIDELPGLALLPPCRAQTGRATCGL